MIRAHKTNKKIVVANDSKLFMLETRVNVKYPKLVKV